jgi:hypothetical protein
MVAAKLFPIYSHHHNNHHLVILANYIHHHHSLITIQLKRNDFLLVSFPLGPRFLVILNGRMFLFGQHYRLLGLPGGVVHVSGEVCCGACLLCGDKLGLVFPSQQRFLQRIRDVLISVHNC